MKQGGGGAKKKGGEKVTVWGSERQRERSLHLGGAPFGMEGKKGKEAQGRGRKRRKKGKGGLSIRRRQGG